MPENKKLTSEDKDTSKLIIKKSIFSKLGAVNFFPDDNASGFTLKKEKTEYKYIYNEIFINSGKLSTPFINSVDYFSGTQGIWGSGTLPLGFTIKQDRLPLHSKSLFFVSTDEVKIGKPKNDYGLALQTLRYEVGEFKIKLQLGSKGSILFKHSGFNLNNKYTKGSKFGEISLTSNSLYDPNKVQENYIGDISFDYREHKNVYGLSVFDVRYIDSVAKTDKQVKYWKIRDEFSNNVPEQGTVGVLPYKLFKDGSNLNTYYKKASSSTDKLSILNNPSRGRLLFSEPYIRTHIGERYGFFNDIPSDKIITEKGEDIISISDFLTRGGITTAISRTIEDTMRIGKFLLSERGLLFTIKQVGLQRMSPRQETRVSLILESLTFAGSFNLNMLASTATSAFGIRTARHARPFPWSAPKTYEESIKAEIEDNPIISGNRLRYLKSYLLEEKDGIAGIIPLSLGVKPGVSNHMHGVYGIIPSTLGIGGFTRVTNSLKVGSDDGNLSFIPSGDIPTGKNKSKSYKNYRRYADIENIARDSSGKELYGNKTKENINVTGWDDPIKDYLVKYDDKGVVKSLKKQTYDVTLNDNNSKRASGKTPHTWANGKPWGKDPISKLSETDESKVDLVVLKFTSFDDTEKIVFRAIVDTYTDAYSPSYTTVNYIGNPIGYPIYQNTKRTIGLGFKVPVIYKDDMSIVKSRLNMLATYTWPENSGKKNKIATPFIKFTYGNLAVNVVSVITTLTYTVDTTSPWELDSDQFPHIIGVQCNLDVIPNTVPFAGKALADGSPIGSPNYWFIGQ